MNKIKRRLYNKHVSLKNVAVKKLLCDCFAVRTVSNFLYSATLALALVLAGCAATKSASAPEPRSVDGDAASAALHEQALRALDARMFVIKGDEFYLPGDKIPVKQSPDSYIPCRGRMPSSGCRPTSFPAGRGAR